MPGSAVIGDVAVSQGWKVTEDGQKSGGAEEVAVACKQLQEKASGAAGHSCPSGRGWRGKLVHFGDYFLKDLFWRKQELILPSHPHTCAWEQNVRAERSPDPGRNGEKWEGDGTETGMS